MQCMESILSKQIKKQDTNHKKRGGRANNNGKVACTANIQITSDPFFCSCARSSHQPERMSWIKNIK